MYPIAHPTFEERNVMTCPECHNQFEGRMPGWKYGSNWDFVPCQTCQGAGEVTDDRPRGDAVEGHAAFVPEGQP